MSSAPQPRKRSSTRCPAPAPSAAACATRWPACRCRTSTWPRLSAGGDLGAPQARRLPHLRDRLAHGTVTAVLHGTPIEVTSLRRDVSTDGRHAEVAWTTDWHEDAARRDFTINSMSMDADGALHDDHGGAADLHAGRVRFVGDPSTRLAEDYLRALRFFRFQARFGRGEPDPAAIAAIRAAVPGLARLSAERVWVRAEAPAGRAGPARVARPDGRCRRAACHPARGRGARAPASVLGPAYPVLRAAALLPLGTDLAALGGPPALSGEVLARLRALHSPTPYPDVDTPEALRRFQARTAVRDASPRPAEIAASPPPRSGARTLSALFACRTGPAFPLLGRDALALGLSAWPAPRPPARSGARMVDRAWRATVRPASRGCANWPRRTRVIATAAMAETQSLALIRRFWDGHMRPQRARMALAVLFTVLLAGITALYPIVIQQAFDMFGRGDPQVIWLLPPVIVAVTALRGPSCTASNWRSRAPCCAPSSTCRTPCSGPSPAPTTPP
jgi:poly(A) polymerase/tRNA nucleotidyltransferase (CCA-adding enzyme)